VILAPSRLRTARSHPRQCYQFHQLVVIILALALHHSRVHPLHKLMSSEGRSRRRELVEEAYKLQAKAGLMARHILLAKLVFTAIHNRSLRNLFSPFDPRLSYAFHSYSYYRVQGAAQYGAFGLGSAVLAQRIWPAFQSVSPANLCAKFPSE
jgi:hypothetical protein